MFAQQIKLTPTIHQNQVRDFIFEGAYSRALEVCLSSYQKNQTLNNTTDLANVYRLMFNYTEAEKYYAIASKDVNCRAENYLFYADMLMNNAKYSEARAMYYTYATRSGNSLGARESITRCDSAAVIASKPVQYAIMNERLINTNYSEFSPIRTGNFIVFTSDRPLSYKPSGEVANTKTDSIAFYSLGSSPKSDIRHSIYEGGVHDQRSEKELKKEQKRIKRLMADELAGKSQTLYGETGRPFLNMFATSVKLGAKGSLASWTLPLLLVPSFTSGEHLGPCAFTPDGNTMYYSYAGEIDGEIGRVGLKVAHKKNGIWGLPQDLPFSNPNKYSVGHPCLSLNGSTLYFASDMPGTFGGLDIFKVELQQDGKWGTPLNLGATINTSKDEKFPTMGPDGELYFSSNGHFGLGGLDIFQSVLKDGYWSRPENLGPPINASSDDFSLTFIKDSKTSGFFSSNRQGGQGNDDIYSFIKVAATASNVIPVEITLISEKEPLGDAKVALKNLKSAKEETEITRVDGIASFSATPKFIYSVTAQKPNYLPAISVVSTHPKFVKDGKVSVKLTLQKLAVGRSFNINNIYYTAGKTVPKKSSLKELQKVVDFMQQNPGVKIEIGSHTDSRGNRKANIKLSSLRAKACAKYLVKKGVDPKRVVSKGYGPTKPLLKKAKTKKQHAKNRRTQIKILSISE
ncbi:MAG: OmpA family protein [Bacteroidales bacterium]